MVGGKCHFRMRVREGPNEIRVQVICTPDEMVQRLGGRQMLGLSQD